MLLYVYLVSQVLALAAQELSKPIAGKKDSSPAITASPDLSPCSDDKPVHWRQEVERRVQSKTRHLRKVVTAFRHLFGFFPYFCPFSSLFNQLSLAAGCHKTVT